MADHTENIYRQYLRVLDERDAAAERAEKAFIKGFGIGAILGIVINTSVLLILLFSL